MHANGFAISAKEKKSRRLLLLKRSVPLYLLILPSLILLIVFTYIPMYGVTIAFKDYKTGLGIFGSEWVGFKNFTPFSTLTSSGLSCGTRWSSAVTLLW